MAGSRVSFISFPSIHRGERNKECPPIQVMKCIPLNVGKWSSINWHCLLAELFNLNSWWKKCLHTHTHIWIRARCSEPHSEARSVWPHGTWNVRMKCHFVAKKHQSVMSRWLFHFALVKKRETTERTNGDYQIEMSYHVVEGRFPAPVSVFYSKVYINLQAKSVKAWRNHTDVVSSFCSI